MSEPEPISEPKPAKPKRKRKPAHARAVRRDAPIAEGQAWRLAYKPEFPDQAKRLSQLGLLPWEIAEYFGVDQRTLRRWRRAYPELEDAMRVGVGPANNRVELSLYHQAVGYYIDDEEIKVIDNKVVRVKKLTFIPPSVTAAIYWTKTKMGWREEQPAPPDGEETDSVVLTEPVRQSARRIAFVLHKGSKVEPDAA